MGDISKAIGRRLETHFLRNFPGFEDHTEDARGVPDFYNSEFGFWVECKNGNLEWGQRLKSEQEERFRDIEEPIVYFLGYHNFSNATQRLAGKTNGKMNQILGRHMEIGRTYFISDSIINAILARETRRNKKGTIDYCMLKHSVINRLLDNGPFRRFGEVVPSAETYYGFLRDDFICKKYSSTVSKSRVLGLILDKKQDNPAIRYFQDNFEGMI